MKRRRVGGDPRDNIIITRGSKRSIDKAIVVVNQTVTTSQVETTLHLAAFPGTITGLRWDLGIVSLVNTSSPNIAWAIVVARESLTASTLSLSNASTLYAPEQDVLAYGTTYSLDNDATGGPFTQQFTDKTKTMRKLQCGDKLLFIALSNVAGAAGIFGGVQFFYKTG